MGRFRFVDDDDDDISLQRESQWESVAVPGEEGALVKSGTNTNGSTSSVAHLNDPNSTVVLQYDDNSKEEKRKIPIWAIVAGFAMLVQVGAILTTHYGPPGPPPADMGRGELISWSDYFSKHYRQLWQSSVALLLDTPKHVCGWWIANGISHFQEWRNRPRPCKFLPTENVGQKLRQSVVGQTLAVDTFSGAIQSWNRDSSLILLEIGGKGTGKQTLVHAMAEHILYCPNERPSVVVADLSNMVQYTEEEAQVELSRMLIESCPSRSVIHLQNIEQLPSQLLEWLLSQLRQDTQNESGWSLGVHCKESIVVLSSSQLGRQTLVPASRHRGSRHRATVLLNLAHEVDQHLDRLSDRVNAILPFFLMDEERIASILRSQLRKLEHKHRELNWNSLKATESFTAHVTGQSSPFFEYIIWRDDGVSNIGNGGIDEEGELMFSSAGAKALDPQGTLWTKLCTQFERCLVSQGTSLSGADIVLDYRDSICVFERCEQGGCYELCNFSL